MNIPKIEVTFKSETDTQAKIRSVVIESFKNAIDAASLDVMALKELQSVAKEFRWLIDEKLGEAMFGPMKKEGTLS